MLLHLEMWGVVSLAAAEAVLGLWGSGYIESTGTFREV